jgi:hypothetical protein
MTNTTENLVAIEGMTITELRPMTPAEIEAEGWEVGYGNGTPLVMVLSNGVRLYPSQDYEGNGGGVLFGIDTDGVTFAL